MSSIPEVGSAPELQELCYQAANHRHPYAQNLCRLPEGDNAFRVHGHAWHRAVLTQILRPEQISGDPTKPVARKNAKQVTVKVPKDLTEVQSSQIRDVRWEHVPQ
jgi:hypothetical protein